MTKYCGYKFRYLLKNNKSNPIRITGVRIIVIYADWMSEWGEKKYSSNKDIDRGLLTKIWRKSYESTMFGCSIIDLWNYFFLINKIYTDFILIPFVQTPVFS